MTPALLSPQTLLKARSLYPHCANGRIHLNHASVGPLSSRVVQALSVHIQERSTGIIETYRSDMKIVADCRQAVQKLIGAESPDRIAFVTNTSDGINIVAAGLPWKTGDRIIVNDLEFPANIYPYHRMRNQGVELDFLQSIEGKITPEMVERALTPRTRLVAISAVQFLSGHRADLEAIGKLCRNRHVWFVVDGIQAVGAVKIDVQEMCIDAFISGGQKWLMAPLGTGFLYLTEEMQMAINQHSLGWLSVDEPWKFFDYDQPLASSARRYEGGTLNIPGIIGMMSAIETLLEFGIDAIEQHILALTRILMNHLQKLNRFQFYSPESDIDRAGIVTIELPDREFPLSVLHGLDLRNICISLREGKLRFSPHFYNSPKEMDLVVRVLDEVLKKEIQF
jgi:cysteine desulfurase / selenocysteine lyase